MNSNKITFLLVIFVAGLLCPSCKSGDCSKKRAAKSDTENYFSPKSSKKKGKKNSAKCVKW